ncbi:MarR family winged helix-turn-helix transcriptional regulator [Micrococcus sp. FDAARGOS_333]|uniref:MarR family winged helix-turn-helix transcriptional regulator n=1 Tax=Micrococcus sp. FDAARGOS_333 TaxID=1930558 RepID=UPI000B4E4147|nr:MarR family transcriptional regulator [Micrococcus sp. FDAARGOS_333]PNL18358.1 MarR family transcriptional regulator [Micrococcus sp. FDAARGOS_333]
MDAAPTPSLALEDQLCFALHRATRAVTRGYGPLLSRLGLTYPQYLVMLTLWQVESDASAATDAPTPGAGALGVGALRDRLGMDNGTITPLVRRLAGMGLVTRERDVHDERRVLVRLTDEGRALRESARTVPADALTRIPLDVTERRALMDQLNRITEAVGPR